MADLAVSNGERKDFCDEWIDPPATPDKVLKALGKA